MLEKKKLSEVEIENKKAEELEVEARNIAEMAYQMEQSSNNIEEKLEQKKVKVDTFIHNTKDLKNFQMKNKENQEKIKELEYRKENKIAEVSSLEEKKIQIKQKIPKL
jgi:multidrug efflux pump subunit AcrB